MDGHVDPGRQPERAGRKYELKLASETNPESGTVAARLGGPHSTSSKLGLVGPAYRVRTLGRRRSRRR